MISSQTIDEYGRVVFTAPQLLELFYCGSQPSDDLAAQDSPEIREYNQWCGAFDSMDQKFQVSSDLAITPQQFHHTRQNEWMMTQEFQNIDVKEWLHAKCNTAQQHQRVDMELALFDEYQMTVVLNLFMYIVDVLNKNSILWGVGRGSSVASYCLFLIGVHKINSLEYDLNIREFLKSPS